MRLLALVLAAGLAITPLQAQVLRTGFEREVNRYRWTATAVATTTAGKWDLDLNNRFASDAYVLFDDRLRFRDENILRLQAYRPLSKLLSAGIRGQLDWFGLSRASTPRPYGGLRI